jgi:hypothetical protein
MALLAVAMVPDSPEGTNAIVIGVSEAPSLPAAGVAGASANLSHTGGTAVGAGVGATVGAAVVGAGTSVGAEMAAVGATGATSVGVAAGLQADSANEKTAINVSKKNVRRLFIFFSFI